MKISRSAPATIFTLTAACGITCSTLAHYAEYGIVAYIAAAGFAFASAFVTVLAQEE